MPCYTPPHSYCEHESTPIKEAICEFEKILTKVKSEFEKVIKDYDQELDNRIIYYKNKSDESTRLLCAVMGEINHQELSDVLSKEVKDWYDKHKQFDDNK